MNTHPAPIVDFSRITEYIYVGSSICCESHLKSVVFDEGIEAIISLDIEDSKTPRGAEFFLWLPIPDNTPPKMEQLRIGVRTIDEFVRMKKKVFVHCKYGLGRGPTLVIAHFIKHGMSVEESLAYLRRHRVGTKPTISQLEQLSKYAEHVRKMSTERTEIHYEKPKTMGEIWKERKGPTLD